MLTPVSRFQFNKTYLYGSAAFVAGFAGVMALLVHYGPVKIAESNVSNVAGTQVANKETTDAPVAASVEETDTATSSSASTYVAPVATPPATEAPAAETPTVTTPTEPTPEPTPEPVPDPLPDPTLPPVIPEVLELKVPGLEVTIGS